MLLRFQPNDLRAEKKGRGEVKKEVNKSDKETAASPADLSQGLPGVTSWCSLGAGSRSPQPQPSRQPAPAAPSWDPPAPRGLPLPGGLHRSRLVPGIL